MTDYSVTNQPPADWHMYADTSPWVKPLDKSNIDPNSATMIRRLLDPNDNGGPISNSSNNSRTAWGDPLYYGRASDPLWTIKTDVANPKTGKLDNSQQSADVNGDKVRAPNGMKAMTGSDGVVVVLDQTTGMKYSMQKCKLDSTNRVIHCWRGSRIDYTGAGFPVIPRGEIPAVFQPIRPEALAAGYVPHTIVMEVRCLSGHNVPPFNESGTIGKTCSSDPNPLSRLSMGNVVFLDMTHAEVDALNKPIYVKAILRGLIDHGACVGINGGAPWTFKYENPLDRIGQPDPYAKYGIGTISLADAVDWHRLKVLAPFPKPSAPSPTPSVLPSTFRLYDDFSNGIPADYHWQISAPFTTKPTVENGRVKIVTPTTGTESASYSRRVWGADQMGYKAAGDTLWFGGNWQIPDPSKLAWTRLLALNHWASGDPNNWRFSVWAQDTGKYYLSYELADGGGRTNLIGPFTLPANREFALDVRVKLALDSTGEAAVYLDGTEVGRYSGRTMQNDKPIHLYQGGLAYWNYSLNPKGQTIFFDKARVA